MGKSKKDLMWVEAKKKCRLNTATIQMAKEMGLSPKSLLKNIPSKNQQWKASVHVWIQDMYEDRFGEEKFKEIIEKYKSITK